eukprot:2124754-Rhodomonas_salina.2
MHMRCPLSLLLGLHTVFHVCHVGLCSSVPLAYRATFISAFQLTFIQRDETVVETTNATSVKWVVAMLRRQGIPLDAGALRELPDAQLVQLAMQAGMVGISPWKRDGGTDKIILHEKNGVPIQATMVSDTELPLYISIICMMFATILLQHIRIHCVNRDASDAAQ